MSGGPGGDRPPVSVMRFVDVVDHGGRRAVPRRRHVDAYRHAAAVDELAVRMGKVHRDRAGRAAREHGRHENQSPHGLSQIGREPPAASSRDEPFAPREVGELVFPDPADGEVLRVGMREIEARHRRRRAASRSFPSASCRARSARRRSNSGAFDRVIGTRRITRRRDECRDTPRGSAREVERLVGRRSYSPQLATHLGVQPLGESLGQTIGQRLQHDRVVVVLRALELGELPLDAEARGDGEAAEVVRRARVLRCDEIGQAEVRLAGRALVLLAQVAPGERDAAALVVRPRCRRRSRSRATGPPRRWPSAIVLRRSLRSIAWPSRCRLRAASPTSGIVEDRGKRPGRAPTPGRTAPSR